MEEEAVRKLLEQLLENSGITWVCEKGFHRFRIRRDGMVWETDCQCRRGRIILYGRYPFQTGDRTAAAKRCCEINLRLEQGAMLLPPDGQPVFRNAAEMDDPYGAAGRLRRALEYNLRAVARFWGTMAPTDTPPG